MEEAILPCQTSPRNFGRSRVSLKDAYGREITGILPISENYLNVGILGIEDERSFVLLPKGMNKETAWINSDYLN